MKSKLKFFFCIIILINIVSCTQQQRAKQFGGTTVENLSPGRKLINLSWKDSHLWILTRSMTVSDVAEVYEYKESSRLGILNGIVIIKETK